MDDTKITILYRNGEKEETYVTDYSVKDGCLQLYKRYQNTRYILLDLIKEWIVV